MNTLQEDMVNVTNSCEIYEGLISLYRSTRTKIEKSVENGGEKKERIEHGDYGYFLHNGNKIIRFFARTNTDKVEAFCTKHFDKCGQRADVNKNPGQYFICGNLFVQKSL